MRVHDSIASVTGANRGLGLMFVKEDMAGEFTLPKSSRWAWFARCSAQSKLAATKDLSMT